MSELLPCPFCGESATIDRVARDWWRVNANHDDDCALDGSHELTVPQTPENRAWAVVAWNRRAARCNDTAPVAPIGETFEQWWDRSTGEFPIGFHSWEATCRQAWHAALAAMAMPIGDDWIISIVEKHFDHDYPDGPRIMALCRELLAAVAAQGESGG